MSIITSQQITKYYSTYTRNEVTFNRQVIDATGLVSNQVFLKVSDFQHRCILFSCSMSGAKVVTGLKSSFLDAIRAANNHVSIRYCFHVTEKADPVSFYVSARLLGSVPFDPTKPNVLLMTLEFNQRPADDLIEILGSLLEVNSAAQKRRQERIIMTPEALKKIGLAGKDTFLLVEGIPRRCLLRDLSFGGAKVLVSGIAKFLEKKKAVLKLSFDDPPEEAQIAGEVVRADAVEGRKDIVALAVLFGDQVPINYNVRIHDYLGSLRKSAPSG
jgi:hypothetical protein